MLRSLGSSMSRDCSGVQKSVPAIISEALGRSTTAPGPNVPTTWLGRRSPRIFGRAARGAALLRAIEPQDVDGTRLFNLPERTRRVPVPVLSAFSLAKEHI